ncbi:MAG: hypothetical protein Q6K80_08235 [Thermostichus sp. DG_1_6_bins_120]
MRIDTPYGAEGKIAPPADEGRGVFLSQILRRGQFWGSGFSPVQANPRFGCCVFATGLWATQSLFPFSSCLSVLDFEIVLVPSCLF